MTLEQETTAAMGHVVAMRAAEAVEFDRMDGSGRTVEYRTSTGDPREFLAYIDYMHDRTRAAVVLGYPSKGTQRVYSERGAKYALGIVTRHLLTEGYAMPETIKQLDN